MHDEGVMLCEAGRVAEALALWEQTLTQMAPSNPNRLRTELQILKRWQADERHHEILERVAQIAAREPPRSCFGLAVLLSEVATQTGDHAPADRLFDACYASRDGWKSVADLEALPCFSLDGQPLTDPAIAADGIIAEFNPPSAPSRWADALTAVEHAMRSLRIDSEGSLHCYDLAYEPNYERRIVPDLGAYIGEVLVRSHGGRWTRAPTLMQRRVAIKTRLVDPFAIAWKAAFYRHPILGQVRSLLS